MEIERQLTSRRALRRSFSSWTWRSKASRASASFSSRLLNSSRVMWPVSGGPNKPSGSFLPTNKKKKNCSISSLAKEGRGELSVGALQTVHFKVLLGGTEGIPNRCRVFWAGGEQSRTLSCRLWKEMWRLCRSRVRPLEGLAGLRLAWRCLIRLYLVEESWSPLGLLFPLHFFVLL